MADEQEKVVYSFEGDVSSLRQATQEAISMLDKYDSAIKSMASKNTFGASKSSAVGFQRVVGSLVRQVNTLTESLNKAGSAVDSSIPNGAEVVQAATKDLADVLSYLNQSSDVTSADLKFLTEVLRSTKSEMESVTSRAHLLASSLKPLAQLQGTDAGPSLEVDTQVAQAVDQISSATQNAQKGFQGVAAAAKTAKQQFDATTQSGFRVQDAYVASGKSAADSATVFLKASRSAEGMRGVQGILQRLQIEMNLFGAYASQAWSKFANRIDPTGAKLQSFKDKATKMLGQVKSILSQVSSAFRRTSQSADDGDDSFENFSSKSAKLSSVLESLNRNTSKSAKHFNLLSSASRTLSNALRALVGINLGQWLSEAAKQSISFAENLNLFTVAMGDSLDVGNEFVAQMAEIYGMDPSNLMRYAGNFYQLADAIDMPDESAAKLSLSLLKATNDISSLFNVPIEQVFNDLSSGMQGMSRAVRKYGMDIRTTTLQQTALSLGITESVESMNEANRQGLRFITMMHQASNASGDFARTIESPANQLKIFKEQMAQLGRAVGNLFIGPLTIAIQYINGFVMALRMVISFIGSILGLVSSVTSGLSRSSESTSESINKIGSSAGGAAKKIKAMLAPFDELNVMTQKDMGGGGGGFDSSEILDPAIADAIANMELKLENLRMKAVEVRDSLLEFFGFTIDDGAIISWDSSVFEANLINKFPQWSKTIQAAFDNWRGIVRGFQRVFEGLGAVVGAIWDRIVGFLSKFINDDSVSKFLENLSGKLDKFANFLENNSQDIADFLIGIAIMGATFKALIDTLLGLVGITTKVAKFVEAIGALDDVLTILPAGASSLIAPVIAIISGLFTYVGGLISAITTGLDFLNGTFIALGATLSGAGIGALIGALGGPIGAGIGALIGLVVGLVTDLVVAIAQNWEDIASFLKKLWKNIVKWAKDTWKAVTDVAKKCWESIERVFEPAFTWFSRLFDSIEDTVSDVFYNIRVIASGCWDLIKGVWGLVASWFNTTVAQPLVNVFGPAWDSLVSGARTAWETVKGIFSKVGTFFHDTFKNAWQGVVKVFEVGGQVFADIKNAISNAFKSIVNSLITGINNVISKPFKAINDMITKLQGITIIGMQPFKNLRKITVPSIPYLASGGEVSSGQLFMARENGIPELVGNFGGRTGVMNNQQIIEAVSEGVYHAVLSAMGSSSNGQETVVEVDGEKLFRIMVGRNRRAIVRTGVNPMGG